MKEITKSIKKYGFFIAMYMFAQNALAALPDIAAPTNGSGSDGNYVNLAQGYILDFFVLAGLVLSTGAFLVVAKNAIGTYSEIQGGKKEWSDLAMHGGVGSVMLVLVVFLMTEASEILVA